MLGAIILQVVLIFLNAIFASAEIAVISMNDTKLENMARRIISQSLWSKNWLKWVYLLHRQY